MKTRTKRAAEALPVPQNAEEANAAIGRIGAAQAAIARIQAGLDEAVAAAKAAAEAEAKPLQAQVEADTRGLQIWAEANRAALTEGGRRSQKMAAGVIGWRQRPPRVTIRGIADALDFLLMTPRLARFLRTKHELNKEAMLAEPAVAETVPGVRIGSAGEEFFVEPAGAAIAPAAVA